MSDKKKKYVKPQLERVRIEPNETCLGNCKSTDFPGDLGACVKPNGIPIMTLGS